MPKMWNVSPYSQSVNSEEDYKNQSGAAFKAEVLAEDSAKDAFTTYETLVAVENKKTFDTGAALEAETPEYTEYSSIEYVPVNTKKYESKRDSLESVLLEGGEEVSENKDGSAVLRPVKDIKNEIIEDKINTSNPASMETVKVIDNENGGKVAEDLNLSISRNEDRAKADESKPPTQDVADKEADGGDGNQDAEEKIPRKAWILINNYDDIMEALQRKCGVRATHEGSSTSETNRNIIFI
ncbi:hypothetical protein FF38_06725 [Lucilia cuprina]|uniref:Uncharacterized protein n=1 Tax=Lucilia cuprina TaxID=7375 RepID=A0A0L0C4X8_LUCCU|nr:hypothetical protein FF38_06725 [Lucilia cuprina]